jgi:hypothetical protein
MEPKKNYPWYIVKMWNKMKSWTPGASTIDVSEIRERIVDYELVLDPCEATAGWAGNAQVAGLATTLNHVRGARALTFNKIAGGVTAMISRTLPAPMVATEFKDHDLAGMVFYVGNVANIDYAFIRIGTTATSYAEWRTNDEDIEAGEWLASKMTLASQEATVGGNGMNPTFVNYIAFGVVFDGAGDVLNDIRVDHIAFHTSRHSTAQINAEISTEISSPNVNVSRISDTVAAVDHGVSNLGTQRVAANVIDDQNGVSGDAGASDAATQRTISATDSPDVTALEIIDDWDATHDAAHSADGPQTMLDYNAVPGAVDDGDAVRKQADAYGHPEGAAYNRSLGAEQVVHVAPVEYDGPPGTARASAVLAAAYDAAPTEVPTGRAAWVLYTVAYTRGAAGGSVSMKLERCTTVGGVDYWPQTSLISSGAVVPGADTTSTVQEEEFDFQSSGAAIDYFCVAFRTYRCHKIRLALRESSGLAVGTCHVLQLLSN